MDPLAFSDSQISAFVGQYIWPLTRIGAFFLAAPVFGTQLVTARARLVLAVLVTLVVVPILPPLPPYEGLSAEAVVITAQQVLIGVAMGFVLQVVFQLFIVAGQVIAMQMGLGFASMMDPANGVSVTVLSQFYLLMVTLLFLSMNGHLVMIEVMVASFATLPIGEPLPTASLWQIANLGSWMFGTAVMIALPVITALLIVNFTFGVMTRSAPQLNIFTIGFPMTLIFGLFIVWASLGNMLPNFQMILTDGLDVLKQLVRVP